MTKRLTMRSVCVKSRGTTNMAVKRRYNRGASGISASRPHLIHGEHAFDEVDELASVRLLGQQLAALQILRHVHLRHVVQVVEDVLARLLGLDARLRFMLLRRLSTVKERGGG